MAPSPTFQRIARYGCTAGIAAIVDVGGFWLLLQSEMPVVAAAIAAFLVATVVNYTLSAKLVFFQPISLLGYRRFLTAALLGMAINVGLTVGLITYLQTDPLLAKLIGTGIAFCANYVLNAVFVFKGQEP